MEAINNIKDKLTGQTDSQTPSAAGSAAVRLSTITKDQRLTVSPLNPLVVLESSPSPVLSPSRPRLTELSVFRMIWRGSPRELLFRKDKILSISTSQLARFVYLPSSFERRLM
jgi:hypothetical protein